MVEAEEVLNDLINKKFERFPDAEMEVDDENSVSSISSQGSQIDLSNLTGAFKSTQTSIFNKIQASVIKLSTSTQSKTREQNIAILTSLWPTLPLSSQQDMCTKVGINQLNI